MENFNPTGYFSVAKFAAGLYLLSILPSIRSFIFLSKMSFAFLWPILILFFWITLIGLYNVNPLSSRVVDLEIFQNVVLAILIVNHARRDMTGLDYGIYSFAFGCFVVAIFILLGIGVSSVMGAVVDGEVVYRVTFFNAGPNVISIKLVTGALILTGLYAQNPLGFSRARRIMLLCCVPFILMAMVKTGSRTALLVLALAGFFWYFASILVAQNKFKIMVVGFVGALLVIVPAGYLVSQLGAAATLVARIAESGTGGDWSQGGRFMIWTGFFSVIGENPLIGNGLSGYDRLALEVFGAVYSPHNVLLEVFIYGGAIGLALYLNFLFKIFRASYKMYRDRAEIIPVLLLPTVLAFVIALQGLSEKTCWLLLAYIMGRFLFFDRSESAVTLRDLR